MIDKYTDKIIATIGINDNVLNITFEDGQEINLYDDGQRCCEHRYITTDDKLEGFVGAELLGFEKRDAHNLSVDEWGEEHEVQFVIGYTSRGEFTLETHNEHNGYYGGFDVVIKEKGDT